MSLGLDVLQKVVFLAAFFTQNKARECRRHFKCMELETRSVETGNKLKFQSLQHQPQIILHCFFVKLLIGDQEEVG